MTRSLFASSACTLLLALTVTGCSTVENLLAGDKVDYRSSGSRASGLEVPPDLTQLAKDSRYQQPSGTVSASTFQANAPISAANATPAPSTVAPQALGALRLERLGSERWLSSTLPPEQLFPLVRTFWKDSGFTLVQDRADAGVLETDWAENRAKLPNDVIRNTIGKVFDGRSRPASSTSSGPGSSAPRPAATSTLRTAGWSRCTQGSAARAPCGSLVRPIRSSKANSCRA